MQITGKVISVRQYKPRPFTKRVAVVEYMSNINKPIQVAIELLYDLVKVGDHATFDCEIRSISWEGKYYTHVSSRKIIKH